MTEYEEFYKKVGSNIDRLRKEKGWSFQEMALRCDLEKPRLVNITKHGANITLKTIYKIAQGSNVSIEELFRESS